MSVFPRDPPYFKMPAMSLDEIAEIHREAKRPDGWIEIRPRQNESISAAVERIHGVLSLVEVNGVWMTPQDARAKQ